MKSPWQADRMAFVVPCGMSAFALVFVLLGVGYFEYDITVLRFPALVTGAILILTGWLWTGWRRRGSVTVDKEDLQPTVTSLAWIAVAIPAVLLLGFGCGLPLFTAVYLRVHKASWTLSLALAAGVFAVAVVLFGIVLRVPLPLWPLFIR
jgi:hypothetical protein